MHARSRALFGGLLLAALLLGAIEAAHLALADLDLTGPDRALAAAYAAAPFALTGLLIAITTAGLTTLWHRARRIAAPDARDPHDLRPDIRPTRSADAGAALLAVVAFIATHYLTARRIIAAAPAPPLGATALALATPIIATAALYFWAATRQELARLDHRLGPRTSQTITATLTLAGLTLIAHTIARNEDLRDRLGGFTAAFLLAYPLLTATLTHRLRRAPSLLARPALRRAVLLIALLSALGTTDLILHLDARPPVKQALLHQTLVLAGLIVLAQPLFDADTDTYAGLLGGGDCDDHDPDVNPGAREIPRNSKDDDCFGGDSPGTPPRATPPSDPPTANAIDPIDPIDPTTPTLPPLPHRPHIILITIDTLRADHLGHLGYPRDTSPHLDALAARGTHFQWAFAQGSQTRASMPSLFIGRYLSEIERSPDLWPYIHPQNTTLAERLQQHGYHTAGIPSHRYFLPGYGLDQGFAEWDLAIIRRFQRRMPSVVTGHLVTDRAMKWLNHRDPAAAPFFLWLHYFDPHHIYQDHEGVDFGAEEIDRYDEEIRYTDEQIGRLLQALAASPFADRTYVIVHSDHGEGFYEHGYRHHGQHLYNDQIRVPLIIAGPALTARAVSQPVALLDIAPTILALAGAPIPSELRGMSLLPYARGESPPRGPVFIEMIKDATHSDRRAIIDWPWKLQYGITFDEYTLFDLSTDPDEQIDLAAAQLETFDRLRARLRQWMSEELEPSRPRR